jgi:chromosome segregation ATPase
MNEETLKKFKDEICRHFDVVAEDLKDNIKIIAEQVAANTEKLQEHDLRFDKIDEKLQEHDLRLNKIEEKLQEHDLRFNKIDEKLQEHDLRLNKIEEKLQEHDSRFNKIEEKLQEHDSRFNKIDEKLQGHDSRLTKIDETLEVIKLDIEFIKNELKQKVSRDEFAALERRVAILEAKIKN